MPFSDRRPYKPLAHRVSIVLLGVVLSGGFASAQLTPPATAIQWETQTDGDWDTAGNWVPASVPDSGADVLFGNVTGGPANPDEPTIAVSNVADRSLRSLWFDAASGIFYTIDSSGTLTLGGGLPEGGGLITVISDGKTQSEHNINNAIVLDDTVAGRARWIVNHSRGGLRLGGSVNLGSQALSISGFGATHFKGSLSGTGTLSTVNAFPYSLPHLILNADNLGWSGALNVGTRTMVFVKADGALGTGANTVVGGSSPLAGGGTLAFRSHVGSTLDYAADAQAIQVSGAGAVRAVGRPGVGAIYHDGGGSPFSLNTFSGDIILSGSTYFGARGDSGGLTLSGAILGSGFLYKIGRGLITLTNSNVEVTRLSIDEGVLRVTDSQQLAGAIEFGAAKLLYPNSSGILEFGGSLNDVVIGLGTGAGQIRWRAPGGFSAFGGDRTVSLNSPGAMLRWGRGGFVANWETLLLSSRYADSKITLSNSIHFQSLATVRVERGTTLDARAEISGAIIGNGGWFEKLGPGRLDLTGANTYTAGTFIGGGVLLGNIPAASSLIINGGVFGLLSPFIRSIGTAANQIRWAGDRSGGFAGYSGDQAVRLNGSTAQIDWGASDFVQTGTELRFGHYTADGTVLWDKQLGLGTSEHRTINVERGIPAAGANRADVAFVQAISGTGGTLTIKGDGRMDIAVDNPDLKLTEIRINGAELRLQQAGRTTTQATNFILKNGGTLTLDNVGTHKATTGGTYEADRVNDDSGITLNASTLRYWGSDSAAPEEQVGEITLEGGANTIDVQNSGSSTATLRASSLTRSSPDTAPVTVNLTLSGTLAEFILNSWTAQDNEINDAAGTPIIPWITVNGLDWATSTPSGTGATLSALTSYQTAWLPAHNVVVANTQTLGGPFAINSLRLINGGVTNNHTLTINSGGLLAYQGSMLSGSGTLTTAASRPLYTHVYNGDLTLSGSVQLDVPSLVKAGGGSLILNTDALHNLGRLYIHQGKVDLQQGRISASHIVIGDGAGKDSLKLPANQWDPFAGKPNVTLRGTPYGPGTEYASYTPDEAILQMGGNTKQRIATLKIENRGTIDWIGGDTGNANILWIGALEFNNADARLFMRNWYEHEDYFLISRRWFNSRTETQRAQLLSQIIFDGYQDFPVWADHYDANYFMITPFHAPEPATYGSFLAAAGTGLWMWRRKRRGKSGH